MPFETTVKVRFADVDRAGIVYYPVILHYCHVAFEDFFELGIGVPYPRFLEQRNLGFPAVKLDTTFEAPFEYGMVVRVSVSVVRIGRSSVTWEYRFFAEDGTRLAVSRNTTVAVDMDTFKPAVIPDDLRAAFQRCRADGDEDAAPAAG